ncbi:hypothetical protein [Chitiniphilus shinanonensis]|nr:hypothetical protein [Chitiniphilus shinanonensis]
MKQESGARCFSLFAVGFSERTQSMLKTVLDRHQAPPHKFVFAPAADAEILIVNGDFPHASGVVHRIRNERACSVVVFGRLWRSDIPDAEYLANPLSPGAFLETLRRIADRIHQPAMVKDEEKVQVARTLPASPPRAGCFPLRVRGTPAETNGMGGSAASMPHPRFNLGRAAAHMEHDLGRLDFRGFLRDADFSDAEQVSSLYLNLDGYLVHHIKQALAARIDEPAIVELLINGQSLVLDLEQNRWGGEFNMQALHRLCLAPLYTRPRVRRLAAFPSGTRVQGRAEQVQGQIDFSEGTQVIDSYRTYRAEFIVAQIGLWCARGHLPGGTRLHVPVRLRHWPNLPNLPRSLGAMQIAALWMQSRCSLLQTVERTALPQRHVFAFYVICDSLGLLEHAPGDCADAGIARPAAPAIGNDAADFDRAAQRGFLQRLLEKVWPVGQAE